MPKRVDSLEPNEPRWKFYGVNTMGPGITYYQGVTSPAEDVWVVPESEVERLREDVRRLTARTQTVYVRNLEAERDRYREALERIASEDILGIGDFSDCVTTLACAVLGLAPPPTEAPDV